MKLFFATDSHLKGRNPSSRTDDFPKAILRKLEELCYTAKKQGATAIIHGGDLFDVPDVSNTLIGSVASIIKNYGIPFYVIPGNHDLFGYNMKSLPQTALGVLERAGVVKLLTRDYGEETFTDGNVTIGVQGQEYYAEIDKGVNNDYSYPFSTADHKILVPHSMLLKEKFHDDVPHTLTKDVRTDADLVLVGHYHPGFADHIHHTTRYINPGSMGRLDATKSSINRIPQYLTIEATGTKKDELLVSFHDFKTAQPGVDVLDASHLKDRAQQQKQLAQFQQSVMSVQQYDDQDVDSILIKLGTEQALTQPVIQAAQELIIQAQVDDKAATDTTGFVESAQQVGLTKIELEGFQSHEDTVIELDNGLNAIVGQSDSGKSAILRAIRWAVYNEPKGTDFIRNTTNNVRVRLEFSSGQFIERTRTRKNAGKYRIGDLDASGNEVNVTEYEGFGNHIPPEVVSIAQMPKSNLGRGDAETLNFAYQLNAPFLISEGGATRASVIGRLTGVHLVDTAIGSVSTEITRGKRELKIVEDDAEKLAEQLQQFSYLDVTLSTIQEAEKKLDIYRLGVDKIEKLEDARISFKEATRDAIVLEQELQKYEHMDLVKGRMQKLDDAWSVYQSLQAVKTQQANAEIAIAQLENEQAELVNLPKAQAGLAKLEQAAVICKDLVKIRRDIQTEEAIVTNLKDELWKLPDVARVKKLVDEMDNVRGELLQAQSLQGEIAKGIQWVQVYGTQHTDAAIRADLARAELQDALNELDICPVCERAMDHAHV